MKGMKCKCGIVGLFFIGMLVWGVAIGWVGQMLAGGARKRGQYVAEMRGLMQALQNNIGRTVMPACGADLDDARCGVDLGALTISGTTTAVSSRRAFTASALAQAADYFTGGVVTFTSGACDGLAMEVKDHASGGGFTLSLPMANDIGIGDTFTVTPGCEKAKATCIAKFDNLVNFRGFSFVPGGDQVLLVGSQ